MKKTLTFLLIITTTSLFSQDELRSYVDFLKEQTDPKEYLFDLWKTCDIIVLGERDHRDTTQYNLILDILSDKRFVEEVGNLYIEVGSVNVTDRANDLIKGQYKSVTDFNKKFVEFLMIACWETSPWDKSNYYQLMFGLTKINSRLPTDKKINIGLFDMDFSWDNMTPEKYKHFLAVEQNKEYSTREKIMANNFLTLYSEQVPRNGSKKALIITSREYAGKFNIETRSLNVKRQAGYIKDVYGDKVKTVALNWYKWRPLNWKKYSSVIENPTNGLSANGKWDAAFELTNRNPVGFNLNDSPFGKDEYDYQFFDNNLQWGDVFDGFIFYEPYDNFIGKAGYPVKLNRKQAREIVRRRNIYREAFGHKKPPKSNSLFGVLTKYKENINFSTQREFLCIEMYPNSDKWKEDMNKWTK